MPLSLEYFVGLGWATLETQPFLPFFGVFQSIVPMAAMMVMSMAAQKAMEKKPKIPKIEVPEVPGAPKPPEDKASPVDTDALEAARRKADSLAKRRGRSSLRIPRGTSSGVFIP